MTSLKCQLFQLLSVVQASMDTKSGRKAGEARSVCRLQPCVSSTWGQQMALSRGCGGTHLCGSKLVSVGA